MQTFRLNIRRLVLHWITVILFELLLLAWISGIIAFLISGYISEILFKAIAVLLCIAIAYFAFGIAAQLALPRIYFSFYVVIENEIITCLSPWRTAILEITKIKEIAVHNKGVQLTWYGDRGTKKMFLPKELFDETHYRGMLAAIEGVAGKCGAAFLSNVSPVS